ncbi:unnamed protein product [Rotaria socialis]|uniref:Uncharacterized protein n=1 Tax=Rotaria socialis TaxID=392032 RepID=A0A817XBQ2_9BILA|nr:unnamed protein product [Rotaria socialis]CAF3437618.1 unnamed protein product [Rotaria socialis]CAF3766544.1 unnamed protein product [Rotaria socialis]
MKQYDLRPDRPKTGDGFFKRIHLGLHDDDDVYDNIKHRGPPKTRWLRAIAAHLQQAIVRATFDGARGEKRTGKVSLSNAATITALKSIGIENKWGDFAKKANRLEFKLVEKKAHYFDGQNKPRETAVAYYLSFRLLKETPQLRTVI